MSTVNRDETGKLAGSTPSILYNGQNLDQPEFHELYLLTPKNFRAELIEGVVHVASPLGYSHGTFDSTFNWFLKNYTYETPGLSVMSGGTTKLNLKNEYQPDLAMLVKPGLGGQVILDAKGYVVGCPDLVVEVSASTLATDLKQKKQVYESTGAREYIVIDTRHRAIFWFRRRRGKFADLYPDPGGVYRSVEFPGLWLDAPAFFREDDRQMTAVLREGLATPEYAAFAAGLANMGRA